MVIYKGFSTGSWKSLHSLGEVDIGQCLEIFLVVPTEWGDAIGI